MDLRLGRLAHLGLHVRWLLGDGASACQPNRQQATSYSSRIFLRADHPPHFSPTTSSNMLRRVEAWPSIARLYSYDKS